MGSADLAGASLWAAEEEEDARMSTNVDSKATLAILDATTDSEATNAAARETFSVTVAGESSNPC